jgi:RNA polymerase sigma-70 factor (ECF subfamily)
MATRTEIAMASAEMALSSSEALAREGAPDRVLLELCRGGDPQAFSRLVALHEGMVFNLAARLLGDPEEARDASQEVFLQVFRTLARFEGRSSLRTWIFRIVVNHCRNRQRWWRRRRKDRCCAIEDLTPAQEARLPAGAQGESPYEGARRGEQARQVQAALLRLSFDHRAILLLREVEELSCEQVAAALHVPEGTVKSRLARARAALRLELAGTIGSGVP